MFSQPSGLGVQRRYPARSMSAAPEAQLRLEWVYGYRGHQCRNNLVFLGDGEHVAYFVAGVGIVQHRHSAQQRFFLAHDDDIISLALHGDQTTVATGQIGKKPLIYVWDSGSMEVVSILKDEHERGIAGLSFGGPNDRVSRSCFYFVV